MEKLEIYRDFLRRIDEICHVIYNVIKEKGNQYMFVSYDGYAESDIDDTIDTILFYAKDIKDGYHFFVEIPLEDIDSDEKIKEIVTNTLKSIK